MQETLESSRRSSPKHRFDNSHDEEGQVGYKVSSGHYYHLHSNGNVITWVVEWVECEG